MSAMTLEESGVADVAAAVKEYEKLQAISKKYKELGGEKGFLGASVSEEHWAPDGQGRYRHYKNGSIYWHPDIGAFEVHGAIKEFWKNAGWEKSFLGYPVTDEMDAPDGKGKYGKFQGGTVRWHPDVGAYLGSPDPVNKFSLRMVKLHASTRQRASAATRPARTRWQ